MLPPPSLKCCHTYEDSIKQFSIPLPPTCYHPYLVSLLSLLSLHLVTFVMFFQSCYLLPVPGGDIIFSGPEDPN